MVNSQHKDTLYKTVFAPLQVKLKAALDASVINRDNRFGNPDFKGLSNNRTYAPPQQDPPPFLYSDTSATYQNSLKPSNALTSSEFPPISKKEHEELDKSDLSIEVDVLAPSRSRNHSNWLLRRLGEQRSLLEFRRLENRLGTTIKPITPLIRSQSDSTSDSDSNLEAATSKSVEEDEDDDQNEDLFMEIEALKEENEKLKREADEWRKKFLDVDKVAFEEYKRKEIEKINQFRKEEQAKIQRDRAVLMRNKRAVEMIPGKKERQELEQLRAQLQDLQKTLQHKNARHKIEQDQLLKTNEDLKLQNRNLTEKIAELAATCERKCTVGKSPAQKISMQPEEIHGQKQPLLKNVVSTTHTTQRQKLLSNDDPERPTARPVTIDIVVESQPECDDPLKLLAMQLTDIGTCINEIKPSEMDGRRTLIYDSGVKLCLFTNGTIKETRPDGMVILRFLNGDVKETIPKEKTTYFFSNGTTHTTFTQEGREIMEFPDGQIEEKYPDGSTKVCYPDGSVHILALTGEVTN